MAIIDNQMAIKAILAIKNSAFSPLVRTITYLNQNIAGLSSKIYHLKFHTSLMQ
jgi:hypothetical protein